MNIWYQYNAFKPPSLAKAAVRSKPVVHLLLSSTPIVESCYCSMFLCFTLFTYLINYLLEIDGRHEQFCCSDADCLMLGKTSAVPRR